VVAGRSEEYAPSLKSIIPSEVPAMDRITTLDALRAETKNTKDLTRNQYVDLRDMDYKHDADTGLHILEDKNSNETFVLQSQTALRQLCRLIKVPYAFVVKNPNYLNDGIMNFWLNRAIQGDETGAKKSKITSTKIVRYFNSGSSKHIRAILDEGIVPIDNSDVIETTLSSLRGDVKLDYGSGVGLDDETFHARFVLPETFDPGDGHPCQLGFHIRSSELAQGNLTLDALIFRQVCSNGAIVTYGNNSYLSTKFKDIMLEDLRSIIGNCASRMQEDMLVMLAKLRHSIDFNVSNSEVRDLFGSLKHRRGLSQNFMESVEGHALDPNISNFWQVTNTITRAAQDLNDDQRIKYEKLAGSLLSLDLPKLG